MHPLFEDPQALGTAIREARERAKMGQTELANEMGTTRQRLGKIERGDEGKTGRTPGERRVLAIAVAELTKAPRETLGLPPTTGTPLNGDEAVAALQRAVGALATLLTTPNLDPAARQLLEAELAVAQQWSTNMPPTEEPESGAENG